MLTGLLAIGKILHMGQLIYAGSMLWGRLLGHQLLAIEKVLAMGQVNIRTRRA
jgi:hypothetical protein